ncbi:MAG: hypothetical protein CL850_04440 [Crocinitomicaceae bacterium]|nr:hypothetical protein [Crocinitomicaceae bacterium]
MHGDINSNMKKFIRVFILISLISCNNSITKEINLPDHVPQISATIIIEQGATDFSALVSASSSLDSDIGPDVIENAVISIMSDGNNLYTLDSNHFNSSTSLYHSSFLSSDTTNTINIPDGQIDLIVSSPNYDEVYSATYMPEKPNPIIIYTPEVEVNSENEGFIDIKDQIDISFPINNLNIDESFLISISAFYLDVESQEIIEETMSFQAQEPAIIEEEECMLFYTQDPRVRELNILSNQTDDTFDSECNGSFCLISDESVSTISNGLENITFFIYRIEKPDYYVLQYMICSISSLSPSLAEHYHSVDSYLGQSGSPFAEPDLMFSNVSSGFGCFGMMNTYTEKLN